MSIETKLIPIDLKYQNGEYRIYDCESEDPEVKRNNRDKVSIKGNMQKLNLGGEYIVNIELIQVHDVYGASYRYISGYQDIPDSTDRQKEYLATIMTELQLSEVYKVYTEDDDVVGLILSKEFDWRRVKGLGEVTFERIYQKVEETVKYKLILGKFGKYSLRFEAIVELANELETSIHTAVEIFEENPYILCDYVSGWGFIRTDIIAQRMGIPLDSPHRIHTGVKYSIEQNQKQGHTYMMLDDLLVSSCKALQLSEDVILSELNNIKGLKILEDRISLTNTYNSECYIAEKLKEMLKNNIELDFDLDGFIEKIERKHNIKLTHQQKDFFRMFKESRVGLLVGYAGSGKTQLQKFLVELLDQLGLTYTFLSPSAQAAKVSTQYTGVKAETIHRKIGWGKKKKDENKIEVIEDVLIVDEAGMEDVFICHQKLKAIKNKNARILFVGDPFQLPSVSAGNLLHDMIESNVIPMTILDMIFRQQEGGIVDIATRIRLKQKFVPNDFKGGKLFGNDFFLNCIEQSQMETAYKRYYDIYLKTYKPNRIMALSPTKKGKLGTVEVNKYIQSKINPKDESKKEFPYGDNHIFREGDFIINTKNSYDKMDYGDKPVELVNGDKGIIVCVIKDAEDKLKKIKEKMEPNQYKKESEKEIHKNGLLVHYDDLSKIRMDFKEIGQLLHAWCITIHKCITDDTWLFTNKGLIQLKELNNGATIGKFKNIDTDIKIFNGNYLERPKSFYNNGKNIVKKIVTKRKYSISATNEHKIDVLGSDGYIEKKEISDVKEGDFLVLSTKNGIFGDCINLEQYLYTREKQDIRTIQYNLPKVMTREFARFLGYMVADGTVCNAGIKFSKRHKEVTEDFRNIVSYLFDYDRTNIKYRKSGDYIIEINSKDISQFCKKIDGIQPKNKFVPKCIMLAPKEYQTEFLKGMFEDGTVNLKKGKFDHIEMCMKENYLCEQIRMMLLNIGIITSYKRRVSSKGYKSNIIYIYKNDAKKFHEDIGFVSKFKKERLNRCLDEGVNSHIYSIPNINAILLDLISKYEIRLNKVDMDAIKYKNKVSVLVLRRFLKSIESSNANLDNEAISTISYLNDISDKKIYFEEAKGIYESEQNTYCLEMPETHKFIQNGFHAYNSQGDAAPATLIIADRSHKFQLSANLIYTAITRSKEKCILLTQAETLNYAIDKVENFRRKTFLQEFLIN